MTVTLGSITLSDHLFLDGLENAPAIALQAKRTIGGRMIATVGSPLAGGRTLILQSENHLTLAQVTAIKALQASGAAVTLTHHRGIFSVRVAAVNVSPDDNYANPDASVWYSGEITLLEV